MIWLLALLGSQTLADYTSKGDVVILTQSNFNEKGKGDFFVWKNSNIDFLFILALKTLVANIAVVVFK